MTGQNDYESSKPCSCSLKVLIFQNWHRCLVLLEEKNPKPGAMEGSSFGAEGVSEMELLL